MNEIRLKDLLPDWSWCVKTVVLAGLYSICMYVYQPISVAVSSLYPKSAMAEKLEMLDQTFDELGLQAYKPEKKRK